MKLSFTKQIIIASILGILAGLVLGDNVRFIKIFGEIFLRLITVMVPFLVIGAIMESVGSLNIREFGSIGLKTLFGFVITSLFAGIVAVIFASILKPGMGVTGITMTDYTGLAKGETFYNAILNFFPRNIFVSFAEGLTVQLIVMGIMIGVTMSYFHTNPSIQKVLEGVKTINVLIIKVVTLIMKMAPLGIFSLLATLLGEKGVSILVPLAKYIGTATLANIVTFFVIAGLVALYGRLSLIQLLKNVKRSIIIAATTSSSAMSLPMKFLDSEDNLGMSKKVSKFVNPLGMSLNTDGGVITTTIASITLAQILGLQLSVQQLLMIAVYSVLSSFGNTMVPGGGIVAIAVVFSMAGLPLEGVVLFAGVDFAVAATRVVLNVVDDMFVGVAVAISENEFDRNIFNRPPVADADLTEEVAAQA